MESKPLCVLEFLAVIYGVSRQAVLTKLENQHIIHFIVIKETSGEEKK